MKKLLILLPLFLFILFPTKAFALPSSVVEFNLDSINLVSNGGRLSFNQYLNSYGFTLTINDVSLHNYYIIYVKSSSTDYLNVSVSGGCNYSCFGDNSYSKIIDKRNNTYYFAIVFPKFKADCGVGTGQCIVENDVRISGNSFGFAWDIIGIDAVNDDTIINNNYQGFLDIINNENNNTQNIINNQNNNTQNIINNQNQNQQQTNEKLDDINNSLNDETGVSQNDVSNKTDEWSSKLAGTGPVSNMVLMPITLLNGYLNGFNSTCSTFNLGNLMGTDIILPCINISNYLGSTLWNVIDILFSGFMIYAIGKKFVKIFNDFTNLRDNQMDELYGGGK